MTLQSLQLLQDNICKCLINAVENYASGYLQNKSNIYLHHSILFLCSRDSPITNSQEVFASWDASWIPGCSKIQPALYPLQHGCMLALHLGCLWRSGLWSIPVTSDHHPIGTSRVDCHPACFPHFLECHRGWDPVQTQQMHQSRKQWHRPASIEESSMAVMAVPTHLGTCLIWSHYLSVFFRFNWIKHDNSACHPLELNWGLHKVLPIEDHDIAGNHSYTEDHTLKHKWKPPRCQQPWPWSSLTLPCLIPNFQQMNANDHNIAGPSRSLDSTGSHRVKEPCVSLCTVLVYGCLLSLHSHFQHGQRAKPLTRTRDDSLMQMI
jgi:hypothetical protein